MPGANQSFRSVTTIALRLERASNSDQLDWPRTSDFRRHLLLSIRMWGCILNLARWRDFPRAGACSPRSYSSIWVFSLDVWLLFAFGATAWAPDPEPPPVTFESPPNIFEFALCPGMALVRFRFRARICFNSILMNNGPFCFSCA